MHHKPVSQPVIRTAMLAFWGVTIITAPLVFGRAPASAEPAAGPAERAIKHDASVLIPLPVFLASLAGTVVCTWKAAKYDNKRAREIEALKREVEALKANRSTPASEAPAAYANIAQIEIENIFRSSICLMEN